MSKKNKKKKGCKIPKKNINPVDFETRFGVLIPWGGDYRVGGATITCEDDKPLQSMSPLFWSGLVGDN